MRERMIPADRRKCRSTFSPLLEKPAAEMGPMDLGVTVDTDFGGEKKITLVPLAMALNADPSDIPVGQKETIGRTVGIVTGAASLKLYRRMFEDPGASFLRMTAETDIDIKFIPSPQTGPGPCPVGGMAVRAGHGPLQHLVPGGKIKLEFHFLVAGKAKIGLFCFQELRGRRGSVHSMTIIAAYGPELVGPSFELKEFFLLLMAFQTDLRPNLGLSLPEREDKRLLPSAVDVFSTRTVAGFTSFPVRRNTGVGKSLPVGIFFLEVLIGLPVAGPAGAGDDGFHIAFRRGFLTILAEGESQETR